MNHIERMIKDVLNDAEPLASLEAIADGISRAEAEGRATASAALRILRDTVRARNVETIRAADAGDHVIFYEVRNTAHGVKIHADFVRV